MAAEREREGDREKVCLSVLSAERERARECIWQQRERGRERPANRRFLSAERRVCLFVLSAEREISCSERVLFCDWDVVL